MSPALAILLNVTYGLTALAELGLTHQQMLDELDRAPDVPDEIKKAVKEKVLTAGVQWRNAPGPR